MNIVVLAGGLSTERDVSLTTGNMVSNALKKKGHRVLLLDVFMGYSDKEEDITGIFERAEEISASVGQISEQAPDIAQVKAMRKDQSATFFGPTSSASVRRRISFLWLFTGKTEKTARFRQRLTCTESVIPEPVI
ncbi:MAG: hypothetical protein V8R80_10420 [Eubacterium sp.]